jgi:hypothetical protein
VPLAGAGLAAWLAAWSFARFRRLSANLPVVVVVAGSLLAPIPASAFWSRVLEVCAESRSLRSLRLPVLPLGCEAPGCCPGCDPEGDLEWLVTVAGEPFADVDLRFSHAPEEDLVVDGDAALLAGNLLKLAAGRVRLTGLPRADGARPATATLTLAVDEPAAEALFAERSANVGVGTEISRLELRVEQMLEGRAVATSTAVIRWRKCPVPRPRTDRVDLESNEGSDEAVVIIDGAREGGCSTAEPWLGRDILYLGNLIGSRECPSRVSVFSRGDAVAIIDLPDGQIAPRRPPASADSEGAGVEQELEADLEGEEVPVPAPTRRDVSLKGWGDAVGDVLRVQLADRPRLPLILWAAARDQKRGGALVDRAREELLYAATLFEEALCGVDVLAGAMGLPPMIGSPAAEIANILGRAREEDGCAAARTKLAAEGWWDDQRLNVYYLDEPFTALFCRGEGLLAVGALAQPETLATRLAAALGLGQVSGPLGGIDFDGDRDPDFGSDNLMWARADRRSTLGLGQCQRAALDPRSRLNTKGLRDGPVRSCPPAASTAGCLPLGFYAPLR